MICNVCQICLFTAGETYRSSIVWYDTSGSAFSSLNSSILSENWYSLLNSCMKLSFVSHNAVMIFHTSPVSGAGTVTSSNSFFDNLPHPLYESAVTVLICFSVSCGNFFFSLCFKSFLSSPNSTIFNMISSFSFCVSSTSISFSLKSWYAVNEPLKSPSIPVSSTFFPAIPSLIR